MNDPLAAVVDWPTVAAAGVAAPGVAAPGVAAAGVAAGVAAPEQAIVSVAGTATVAYPWASVTKVLTALAIWVAVEEGTVDWDDPAGPPGATLAHLLAHASGLAPDGDHILAAPGTRRIYSNRGFEVAAAHVSARSGLPFEQYVKSGVLEPLGLDDTTLSGSPASGASGPVTDLLALGRELQAPTLISGATLAKVTAVSFEGLVGVLPGFGRQDPNDWGLGVEIRDDKHPHWTGTRNSPGTFGHFGRSGSFLWVDPVHQVVLVSLAERPFGPWATTAWPALADAVIDAFGRP